MSCQPSAVLSCSWSGDAISNAAVFPHHSRLLSCGQRGSSRDGSWAWENQSLLFFLWLSRLECWNVFSLSFSISGKPIKALSLCSPQLRFWWFCEAVHVKRPSCQAFSGSCVQVCGQRQQGKIKTQLLDISSALTWLRSLSWNGWSKTAGAAVPVPAAAPYRSLTQVLQERLIKTTEIKIWRTVLEHQCHSRLKWLLLLGWTLVCWVREVFSVTRHISQCPVFKTTQFLVWDLFNLVCSLALVSTDARTPDRRPPYCLNSMWNQAVCLGQKLCSGRTVEG